MSPSLERFYPEVSGLDEEDLKLSKYDKLEVSPVDIEPENVQLIAEIFTRILKSKTGAVGITFPTRPPEINSDGLNEVAHTLQDGFEKAGIKLNTVIIPGDGYRLYPEIVVSLKR